MQARIPINYQDKIDALVAQFASENSKKAGCFIIYSNDLAPYLRTGLAGGTPGFPADDIRIELAVSGLPFNTPGNLATSSRLQP